MGHFFGPKCSRILGDTCICIFLMYQQCVSTTQYVKQGLVDEQFKLNKRIQEQEIIALGATDPFYLLYFG